METTSRSAVVTLPSDTTILITREFAAPKHLVYRAWTEPELVRRWWHAKRGVMTVCDIDLRVGGAWRYVMGLTDESGTPRENGLGESEIAFHGEFREIVPNERLVSTEVYEPFPFETAVNTLTLTEHDGGTTMTMLVEHSCVEARDGHVNSGMEDGLQDALDLAEQLAVGLA